MSMTMSVDGQRALEDFWQSQVAGAPLPMAWAGRLSLKEGCLLQLAIADRWAERGNARTGWKVAATSAAVQAQLGVTEPGFGSLRQSKTYQQGYILPASQYVKPHVEVEICVEVGDGIDKAETIEDVNASLVRCFPAFELIEKRITVLDFGFALADNAEHTAVVVGDPFDPSTIALDEVEVRVTLNGQPAGAAFGRAALGHPLNSVLWLKQRVAELGGVIRPGDLIMTGSLVRQIPVEAGDVVRAEYTGLGALELKVDH